MVGALAFNVNTVVDFIPGRNEAETRWFAWGPAVVGSVLFTVGGVLECYHNSIWNICRKDGPNASVFWLSFCNAIGGMLFLVAAASGFVGGLDYDQYNWLVNFPYLAGSLAFWFGSYFSLWMWKNE